MVRAPILRDSRGVMFPRMMGSSGVLNMKRFTDSGRKALDNGNQYIALTLALTLPDICGSIESPGTKSQKRYEAWFKTWLEPTYTSPTFGGRPATVFLSSSDCFQLRCS